MVCALKTDVKDIRQMLNCVEPRIIIYIIQFISVKEIRKTLKCVDPQIRIFIIQFISLLILIFTSYYICVS